MGTKQLSFISELTCSFFFSYQSVFPEGFKMNLCKEHVLSDEDAIVVQQAFSQHLPDGVFTVRKKDRVSYTQRKLYNVNHTVLKTKIRCHGLRP
jgi:hypothetical protein